MKLFTAHDSHSVLLERKIGFFAFAGLGILLLVFVIVAIEQGMFASTTVFRFRASDASLIHEGMEVKLSGFMVGKLSGISLQDNGEVEVRFFVDDQYLQHILRGAKLRLAEQGLFGDAVLEIIPGPKNQPMLAANDLLPFERKLGMVELAHDLTERLKPIFENVQITTALLNETDGLINNARKAAQNFEKVGQDMSALMQYSRGIIAEENLKLGRVLEKSGTALDKTGALLDKADPLLGKAGPLLDKTGTLLGSIQEVAADVGKIAESSAQYIPPILHKGRVATDDASDILGAAKASWPIRNMMETPEIRMLPMDSYGVADAQPK